MSKRTILVTGAGGFIGGRVVEVLHTLGVGHVKAGLRRWSSGARVGRFPVELVRCDQRNETEVREALKGVTHVVNCAVSMDRTATVEGTRTLMRLALEAGVERAIHVSSIAVYGNPHGEVTEQRPLTMTGNGYGDMKIEAEQVAQEQAARGLPLTILRPTLVHGAFGRDWTVAYAQRLQAGSWLIPDEQAQGTCNLIYVDDLVGFIIAALDADVPSGEAFNVNGPERPTWSRYFHALNDAMGLPPLVVQPAGRARAISSAVDPLRRSARLALKYFEPQIMGAYKKSELVRTIMKRAEGTIRNTPAPAEFAVYSHQASFSTEKAERMLGYTPAFPLSKSLPPTAAWLRANGFVRPELLATGG